MTQSLPVAEEQLTGRGGRSMAANSAVAFLSALEIRGDALTYLDDSSAISHTVTEDETIILAETDNNGGTVTLPGSPNEGRSVLIHDATGNAGTNAITVARNGNNIDGAASNFSIGTNNQAVLFVWVPGQSSWYAIEFA